MSEVNVSDTSASMSAEQNKTSAEQQTPILRFNNVSSFYGKIQALHGVSLEVHKGEIVTLIGANGAGKSTTLMTLCGEPRAASGSIHFEGIDITGLSTPLIMRHGIAVAP